MHLLYFHKAGQGEWQKKRGNVRAIYFYLFIMNVYIRAFVCVCACLAFMSVFVRNQFFYRPASLSTVSDSHCDWTVNAVACRVLENELL